MSPDDAIEYRLRRAETDLGEHEAELRELREAVAVVPSLVEAVADLKKSVGSMTTALYVTGGGIVVAAFTFAASVATGSH